ncbi:putative transposase of IS4/5 family DUF4096 [Pseudonocardia hierapolitana]|uniref:Putative transposase of IS4/5 family DUF4096 n=1 Tax=Pseudonocardia hierapolitana TaxID=1128676 RepID=A0A561T531_9PSEU|nr:putative transposase of IS4/5 family DUF4096 [Pseudonocardia hierapolitana]
MFIEEGFELIPQRCVKDAVQGKDGLAWRDLPERYGLWKTVYNRFWRWARNGTMT